jgi:hypothetical protein
LGSESTFHTKAKRISKDKRLIFAIAVFVTGALGWLGFCV